MELYNSDKNASIKLVCVCVCVCVCGREREIESVYWIALIIPFIYNQVEYWGMT